MSSGATKALLGALLGDPTLTPTKYARLKGIAPMTAVMLFSKAREAGYIRREPAKHLVSTSAKKRFGL